MLALEDLENYTEQEVVDHLVKHYSDDLPYDSTADKYPDIADSLSTVREALADLDILIAYESVGSWGCDSSSYFLFKHKITGQLYEISGGHCSCYGFEGQFELNETSPEVLKSIVNNGGFYFTGGYDTREEGNKKDVYDFILNNL